ncbi:J domain-containing protein [Nodularia spumigena]|jgi:tetratricopeptide (TPR) repeat protein|uniref:Chaperone protein DnaJ 1 n=1 Tax=Nodularia spumigena UHCC 0039 TaxID=1914872 RepID=A0A2S0Q9V5_NODSP|nr:CFI-box-CTERM domain-containing protein [Nodularia spumigena]AVZ31144.1 chaperone protein DnaJ 1 [Nodularia spumigena UHCC 0039]MEA5554990.1 CFI-box-CTERM domain-containing protein [Nodularia spumigena CH309]
MAYELYQTLNIPTQASPEDIRRAYYRLVRKHSPEKDPERFKVIREAYETLSDAKAKQNYDSVQQHGGQIVVLLSQAEERMEEENWPEAIRLLKHTLVLSPGADSIRNRLGLCYIHHQQWDEATKTYQILTASNPDVAVYWSNFGCANKEIAETISEGDSRRSIYYQKARICFQKSVDLEPFNSQPFMAIAQTFLAEENYTQALKWAEKAIGADGKIDFQDFDALFLICIINLRSNQLEQVTATADRIIACLPADEDIRKYVAAKFALIGFELLEAGAKYINPQILKAALTFMSAAKRFSPDNAEIATIQREISEVVNAFNEYDILKDDYQIINGFKRLAAFRILNALGSEDSASERDRIFKDIISEISNSTDSEVLASAKRIKSKYPAIYRLNAEFFARLEKVAAEISRKQQYQPQTQPTNNSSDDCFVVTATYGTPHAAEVIKYRYFRDKYLRKHILGRKFIQHYYHIGPLAASQIKKHPNLKKIMALILGKLAKYLPN